MAEPEHPLDVGNTFDSLSELKQACATRAISDAFDQPLSFNFAEYLCNMEDESEPEDGDEVLEPPNTRRPAGRPKTKRIRRVAEIPTRSFKCGRCQGEGHSKRTCTAES
jgi:hypothetical protein